MSESKDRKVEGGLKYVVVGVNSDVGGVNYNTIVKSFDDSLSAIAYAESLAHAKCHEEIMVARCFRSFKTELRVVEVSYA